MAERTRGIWWQRGERSLSLFRVLPKGTNSRNMWLGVLRRGTSTIISVNGNSLKSGVWTLATISGFGKHGGGFREIQWCVFTCRLRGRGAFSGGDVNWLGSRTLGLRSAEGRSKGQLGGKSALWKFDKPLLLLNWALHRYDPAVQGECGQSCYGNIHHNTTLLVSRSRRFGMMGFGKRGTSLQFLWKRWKKIWLRGENVHTWQ